MQLMGLYLNAGVAGALGAAILSACVPPAPEPTPVPSPTSQAALAPQDPAQPAAPAPAAPLTVTPAVTEWMDAPQTPGDWFYALEPTESLAVFGTGPESENAHLVIRCNLLDRRVGIARTGTAEGQVEMLVRTETQERRLTASQVNGRRLIAAELAASDPLLDAVAFSRGRFAVDVPGTEPVYAPAYPEITRVVEDCRG